MRTSHRTALAASGAPPAAQRTHVRSLPGAPLLRADGSNYFNGVPCVPWRCRHTACGWGCRSALTRGALPTPRLQGRGSDEGVLRQRGGGARSPTTQMAALPSLKMGPPARRVLRAGRGCARRVAALFPPSSPRAGAGSVVDGRAVREGVSGRRGRGGGSLGPAGSRCGGAGLREGAGLRDGAGTSRRARSRRRRFG